MTRLVLILLMSVSAFLASVAKESKPFVVVIDVGHGGKDIGCKGKLTNEKTIVLDVAKRLGGKISKKYGDKVKVVYTRSTDKFVELADRAKIANDAHGNLFISIHVNSVDKKSRGRTTVKGASVYTCGLHKSDANLRVAMRENSVMELEKNSRSRYKDFDPNSSESYIIFELTQNAHLNQSLDFASRAQRNLVKKAGRADKDVRQAGFWVLWSVSMPSVLVELDFICNPTSEKFLHSAAGKEKCATALFEAFDDYYKDQKKTQGK